MADNMCGPSNGAKNLLSHADRDRSLYQDRVIGAPNGGNQSFRNQMPTANGDAAFQSFLASPVGPQAASPMPGMVDHFGRMELAQQSVPGMNVAQARAANAGMSVEQYHSFLQGMNGQPGVAQSSIATPIQHTGGPLVNPQSVMAAPVARNANPTDHLAYLRASGNFMGSGFPITHPMTPPMMQQAAPLPMSNLFGQAAPANVQGTQVDPAIAISAEAFNDAFAEFDDGEFQHELDNWMAEHGASAESAQQRPAEPTAEEWDEINANMEQIANDADAARVAGDIALQPQEEQQVAQEEDNKLQTQQELVRAATDILTSVSNNTSQKFKQSTFLELMRRIRDHEVTVVDNSLVDVETGVEIVTKPNEDVGGGSDAEYPAEGSETSGAQP
ncbi:hypothetical protein BR93DRAFT_148818 [Coniochaeta sp. PMI_546]|nr:hypothetical protein BR93DRAFT_148818 [Coniochaeta sp. PMI_546]